MQKPHPLQKTQRVRHPELQHRKAKDPHLRSANEMGLIVFATRQQHFRREITLKGIKDIPKRAVVNYYDDVLASN